jgi:hypothetical protein
MKRELILGIGGIACAGAIIGGALLINNDFNFLKKNPEEDYSKKIEALWFEELKDKSKYSFCLGEMDIRSTHSDSLLGANGAIDYTSKEVAVFNKETNRLYVMSRQSKYGYKGVLSKALDGAGLNAPVIEYGSLTENYGKNEMPIRLDYTNKYITTDPEVKNKQ